MAVSMGMLNTLHKDTIKESQANILDLNADIESYKRIIERDKKKIQSSKIEYKEYQDQLKGVEVNIEKAKSTDPRSKIYDELSQSFYDNKKRSYDAYENYLLIIKRNIEFYEKEILRSEEMIKMHRGRISDSKASLKKQSSDGLEKVVVALDQRVQTIYSSTFIGVLLFHSMSMLLFFIIAKSWIAKDPFSKRVIISFRLLGILWISHAVFTFGYFRVMALSPDKLQLMNQISSDLLTIPEFGNIDSLIAGLLFLCLSYIMDHGSKNA